MPWPPWGALLGLKSGFIKAREWIKSRMPKRAGEDELKGRIDRLERFTGHFGTFLLIYAFINLVAFALPVSSNKVPATTKDVAFVGLMLINVMLAFRMWGYHPPASSEKLRRVIDDAILGRLACIEDSVSESMRANADQLTAVAKLIVLARSSANSETMANEPVVREKPDGKGETQDGLSISSDGVSPLPASSDTGYRT